MNRRLDQALHHSRHFPLDPALLYIEKRTKHFSTHIGTMRFIGPPSNTDCPDQLPASVLLPHNTYIPPHPSFETQSPRNTLLTQRLPTHKTWFRISHHLQNLTLRLNQLSQSIIPQHPPPQIASSHVPSQDKSPQNQNPKNPYSSTHLQPTKKNPNALLRTMGQHPLPLHGVPNPRHYNPHHKPPLYPRPYPLRLSPLRIQTSTRPLHAHRHH